jgi:mono/diheme cytochrome c family protein
MIGDPFTSSGIYFCAPEFNAKGFSMKIQRLMIATVCTFLAFRLAYAQTAQPDASLTANPVYTKNCAKCHGKTAEGHHFGGPSLSSAKAAAASPEDLRKIISDGKGHMPKYAGKLSAEEIDTLVKQIEALNKK